MESIIATVLASGLILLILTTFMVQNELYLRMSEEVAAGDAAWSAAAFVDDELRYIARSGILYAGSDSLVYRVPLVITVVCGVSGYTNYLHFPLRGTPVESAKVASVATRSADGNWTYFSYTWAQLNFSFSKSSAAACAARGTDTTGVSGEFAVLAASGLTRGDLLMVFQERRVFTSPSALDPGQLGLFVSGTGEASREVVSGVSGETGFRYRLLGGTWTSSVNSYSLRWIDAVEFTVAGGVSGAERWTTRLWLTNHAS